MEFWPEFMASSWGREFVAGGFGGIAGIVSGYPLDTLRIRQQSATSSSSSSSSSSVSAVSLFKRVIANEGPSALYRGMAAPLASVTFQNAVAFQTYAVLSRAFDTTLHPKDPPSLKSVYLGGVGTGALQSILLSPVELLKIRLQLQQRKQSTSIKTQGPTQLAKQIYKTQGIHGIYRGFTVTVLRDAPAHGVYFWTYEYMREKLHPGCRKTGDESLQTMLVAGGLAGVASWVVCYPLDVLKTRIQADGRYVGIWDCFVRSVGKDGYGVLWRGLGTAVARAFVVNGAVFAAYELSLRSFFSGNAVEATTAAHEGIKAENTI